jgi:NADH-quinone oxidoreductase subunit N
MLAMSLAILLLSIAGIPPLAGFFIKYYILLSLINLSLYSTTFLILLLSTISCYYYLNFIKYIKFEKKKLKALYYFNIERASSIP